MTPQAPQYRRNSVLKTSLLFAVVGGLSMCALGMLLLRIAGETDANAYIVVGLVSAIACMAVVLVLQRYLSRYLAAARVSEEALAREQYLLRALMEGIPDHIYFKDRESRFVRVNPAMARRFGTTPEAIAGKTDFDFFTEAHARPAFESEQTIVHTGTPLVGIEEKETWADGRETWVSTTKLPLRDARGAIVGTFGMSRDITELKVAQEQERATAHGLRAVLAMADELLACDTLDDIMRRGVELPREYLGLERTGLFLIRDGNLVVQGTYGTDARGGTTDERAVRSTLTAASREALARIESEGLRWDTYESGLVEWRDGQAIPLRRGAIAMTPVTCLGQRAAVFFNDNGLTGKPLVTPKQDALAVYCSLLGNMLQRKQAEETLRESELQARRITDNMRDVIYQTDGQRMLEYVSPSVRAVLGYEPAELLGTSVNALLHPEDLPVVEEVSQQLMASHAPFRVEARVRHASGSYIWCETMATPLTNGAGEVQGVLLTSRDVTERRLAQEELARSNAELQQFAYVASHDLQEPLRMIASYVQLLARRYRGKLDDDADEFIGYAVEGAGRMKTLINDLLTYSRVGTHGKPFARVAMGTVAAQALDNLQLAIEDAGASVTVGTLPTVMADETQALQLMQNLVGNAIKFRGAEPPRIEISAAQAEKFWHFRVRDNGIGIDPQYAERIFVMFQRLHTKEDYPGTGIGLAVCKKIVERHGGRIWVETAPAGGSVFNFTIPVAGELQ